MIHEDYINKKQFKKLGVNLVASTEALTACKIAAIEAKIDELANQNYQWDSNIMDEPEDKQYIEFAKMEIFQNKETIEEYQSELNQLRRENGII